MVEGHFALEDVDKAAVPEAFRNCTYVIGKRLDNTASHRLDGGPAVATYASVKSDLARLVSYVDARVPTPPADKPAIHKPGAKLESVVAGWHDTTLISDTRATALKTWLSETLQYVEEGNKAEEDRHQRLMDACNEDAERTAVLETLRKRKPVFVLFSNYFRVRPLIHLEHLATRLEKKLLDDDQYDYGNQCLLKLLGFMARELSDLGKAAEPVANDQAALQKYRDQLDKRSYQLNAASVRLTNEIRNVWLPVADRGEADKLRVVADGQYLKVVVEDALGVEIELDQRSEGFQWLVSFFVVFFAEAADKHSNAVLLLDEPGLSLHGLKQRDFRQTISRLAEKNQTIYSTHSPFLVGPGELDIVRVIEMPDRAEGTRVHNDVTSDDPGALLPLQEALGYDLAQSLFAQQRNLVLEGLTDYWYVEAVADLLRAANLGDLNQSIALVPARSAGKVVYYATILHAHKLKVAALLDSDAAGDQAAKQDILVHRLGNRAILRTKDSYTGSVQRPEIEDLLRDTLVRVANSALGWNVSHIAAAQPARPIIDIFAAEVPDFSKYKLAKAFLRWTRDNEASELTDGERAQWSAQRQLDSGTATTRTRH